MPYSDFTLAGVRRLGVTVVEGHRLFAGVPDGDLPPRLAEQVERSLPLALNLNTEKARSELLIAPMLFELRFKYPDRVSVFSGIEFTVDAAAGLSGRCDYIVSRSPQQLALTAPACVLVEAKAENIVAGIPQCLAEMVAAARFNAREGAPPGPIFGAVTTGVLWRFLRLDGDTATVDDAEYPIQSPDKIFAILRHAAA